MNKKEIEKKLKEYEKQGFDDWQLYEIRKGLENGVDVTKYTDLELSDEEMAKIRKELFQDNLEKDQVLEVEEKENSIDKNIDINNMNIDSFNIGQQKQIECSVASRQMLPGVCPGVCRTCRVSPPHVMTSPSARERSIWSTV